MPDGTAEPSESRAGEAGPRPQWRRRRSSLVFRAAWLGAGASAMVLCLHTVPTGTIGLSFLLGRPRAVLSPGLQLLAPAPFGSLLIETVAPRLAGPAAWPAPAGSGAAGVAPSDQTARAGMPRGPGAARILYRIHPSQDAAFAAALLADPDAIVATEGAAAALRGPSGDAFVALTASLARQAPSLEVLALMRAPDDPAPAGAVPGAVSGAQGQGADILAAARAEAEASARRAREQAASKIAQARARAAEIVAAARVERVTFAADREAAQQGGKAFLLERYFANLSRALAHSPKTIIDHRLNWPEAPELDLRPPSGLPGSGAH